MRKTLSMKVIISVIMAMLLLTGCGAENKSDSQSDAKIQIAANGETERVEEEGAQDNTAGTIEEDSETLTQTTFDILGHWEYTGYEDEWNWGGEENSEFINQDYDNDGLYDRVYREQREDTEFCHYRIEFGNGIVIDMDKDVYCTGFPHVKVSDINGDGENEIIFSQSYDTSTDMRDFGDFVVYEKYGDTYRKAALPFKEADEGYCQEVSFHYEVVRNGLLKVSVAGNEYETLVPINDYQWFTASYGSFDGETSDKAVWDSYFLKHNGQSQLVCKIHLFDKWSTYGLFAVLSYRDGKYIIDRWLRVNDEIDDTIDSDSLWALEDYRLCGQEIETASGNFRVELWLGAGEYGSEEELVPGGGVYEENYMGEYYLLVMDEEGNILSKREIVQDFSDMGSLNFPGAFELIFQDYNQDSCPDFTIGTYGSSAVNLYALYTIWENGEIGLLGKDIPNCSPGDFSVAFESGNGQTFYASIWDNAVGEEEKIGYVWDEGKKEFVETAIK